MSTFTALPEFRPYVQNESLFEITKGFRFYLSDSLTGEYVDIPIGTITNFASIPRILHGFLPPWHRWWGIPSVIHDGMVGEFGQPKIWIMKDGQRIRQASWGEAAIWFRVAIRAKGGPEIIQSIFYHSVMQYKRLKKLFS